MDRLTLTGIVVTGLVIIAGVFIPLLRQENLSNDRESLLVGLGLLLICIVIGGGMLALPHLPSP
jgi:hypothetical protein